MKKLDLIIWTLLAIGGLNWGLVGLLGVDLVAAIFGELSIISRILYLLIGLAAAYDVIFIKLIWKRWDIHPFKPAHT